MIPPAPSPLAVTPNVASPYAAMGIDDAPAPATYIDPATGMYMPVVPAGSAMVPTEYVAAPVAGSQAGAGVSLLDELVNALVPEDAPVVSAPVAVALPYAAAAVAAAAPAPVAVAAAPVAEPAAAPTTKAKRKGSELWAGVRDPRKVHVTQVASKFNRTPVAGNRDCGPASVVMALRMLGRKIPGAIANASPQQLINRARGLGSARGSNMPTTNLDLERALNRAGADVVQINDAASVRAAVEAGRPVILNGNPRNPGAYGPSFGPDKLTPFNGPHWIVVSGIDTASGKFIINDPLAQGGVLKVTAAQLEAYRNGSMGLEVSA